MGNYLRQADQSQAVELGVATGASEGGRKGAELGLGHRGAVAVVDVQHGHLILAGLNENQVESKKNGKFLTALIFSILARYH